MSNYNKNLYDKVYKHAIDSLVEVKYLYAEMFVGLILACYNRYPVKQEAIDACKDALIEQLYDGMDIEFEDEKLVKPRWLVIIKHDCGKYQIRYNPAELCSCAGQTPVSTINPVDKPKL